MDMGFYGQLATSMAIFAPGLILFTVFSIVGLLMLLEKSGVLGAMVERKEAAVTLAAGAVNPAPSAVVSGLKSALSEQAEGEVRKTATR